MFDFGDEVIIDSYRIPWLIWIQLLVMLLLIILLFSLGTSPSDLSLHSTAASSPSPSSAANLPLLTTVRHTKAGGNQINETGTSTSSGVQGARKDESRQRDDVGPPIKDAGHGLVYGESYHPCNFLGLAKQAFLKCLGLDSSPESQSKRKHGKDD